MDRSAKPRSRGDRKTELHIFDFDQTLFHSPGPPPSLPKEERGKFWHDPESLGGELVPETPNENWYVRHVVDAFRQARKNPRALVVVMTGRSEPFRRKVTELLRHEGLEPDELVLKQEQEPTKDYKTREMKRILKEHPDVKKVHFHEDREEHLRDFQEAAEAEGYQFIPHHVPEADADRTWDTFLEVFYDGGAKQVQNTNPESRDQHPTVRADHLMRTDPNFGGRIQRQFRKWIDLGKPKKRQPSKEAARRALLRLTLDFSPEAVRNRVATAYLRRLTSAYRTEGALQMNSAHRIKFQRYEVAVGERDLRHFQKTTKESVVLQYAADQSAHTFRDRAVTVWAVSSQGATGQRVSNIAVFVNGRRVDP